MYSEIEYRYLLEKYLQEIDHFIAICFCNSKLANHGKTLIYREKSALKMENKIEMKGFLSDSDGHQNKSKAFHQNLKFEQQVKKCGTDPIIIENYRPSFNTDSDSLWIEKLFDLADTSVLIKASFFIYKKIKYGRQHKLSTTDLCSIIGSLIGSLVGMFVPGFIPNILIGLLK